MFHDSTRELNSLLRVQAEEAQQGVVKRMVLYRLREHLFGTQVMSDHYVRHSEKVFWDRREDARVGGILPSCRVLLCAPYEYPAESG